MSGLMYGAGGRGFEKPAESNLGEYQAPALPCDTMEVMLTRASSLTMIDSGAEDSFAKYFASMPEKPDGMVRLFDRAVSSVEQLWLGASLYALVLRL
jgi:hypothetical protein